MADVFLSYAREDQQRVQPIIRTLESSGFSVWWDRHVPLGKSFAEVIDEALSASKCVVVVWTTNSVTSRWVKLEAAEGDSRGILAPVRLDDVRVPLEFRSMQTANLRGWKGGASDELTRLIVSVRTLVSVHREDISATHRPPKLPPAVRRFRLRRIVAASLIVVTFALALGVNWVLKRLEEDLANFTLPSYDSPMLPDGRYRHFPNDGAVEAFRKACSVEKCPKIVIDYDRGQADFKSDLMRHLEAVGVEVTASPKDALQSNKAVSVSCVGSPNARYLGCLRLHAAMKDLGIPVSDIVTTMDQASTATVGYITIPPLY